MLDYSKIVSGELEIPVSLVNLERAVQSVVAKYRPYAKRKGQEISVTVPRVCQYVMANDLRLCQVLGHLLENAIKFSPNQRSITIRASEYDSGYVRVDVVDHGIGIKPEDMGLLFEDFRQLDSSFTREYGGAGMGLAISKHLVELQGGVIWVESEYGKGSTFSFVLPRAAASNRQTIQLAIPHTSA